MLNLRLISAIAIGFLYFPLSSSAEETLVVDPGTLDGTRFGFTMSKGLADVSSGWFHLLPTDEIWVTFDYPTQSDRVGAYIVHEGLLCFSGFEGSDFPKGCGDLGRHEAVFADRVRLWFANAEPGAFYPGDNLERLRLRYGLSDRTPE